MSIVQIVTIDEDRDGQRLDNFLLYFLKGVPKSWVYRVIRKGEVRINGKRAKPLTLFRRVIWYEYRLYAQRFVRLMLK